MNEIEHLQITVETLLLDLARFHRRQGAIPDGLITPLIELTGKQLTTAWTSAELNYLSTRLSAAGFHAQRERGAGLTLPPDLVARGSDGRLLVHIERETRGFEWNHIIGALIKLLFVNDDSAPVAVLVLDNFRGDESRVELLLKVIRRLLTATRGVTTLYVAFWREDGRDARVLKAIPKGESNAVEMRWLLPELGATI